VREMGYSRGPIVRAYDFANRAEALAEGAGGVDAGSAGVAE
jgi:hypothetical protein